jgi:hypothetical protein
MLNGVILDVVVVLDVILQLVITLNVIMLMVALLSFWYAESC